MATVQEEILDAFLTRLGKAEGGNDDLVRALRALFQSGDKLKAEDLVDIFSARKKKEDTL